MTHLKAREGLETREPRAALLLVTQALMGSHDFFSVHQNQLSKRGSFDSKYRQESRIHDNISNVLQGSAPGQ